MPAVSPSGTARCSAASPGAAPRRLRLRPERRGASAAPAVAADEGRRNYSMRGQRVPEHLLELEQRFVGIGHLDGAHAKGSSGLEIDAQVVEEDRLLGLDAE